MEHVVAWVAAAGFVAFISRLALDRHDRGPSWMLPAAASLGFLAFSSLAVAQEGFGFWPEHTRNLWGNQIWLDLLLAASVALTLLVPRARKVGMRPLVWVVLVVATGSVALLAMLARVLYLEHQAGGRLRSSASLSSSAGK